MKSLHIQPNQHQGERFPQILHSVLGVASGDTMISSIVSWTPDGKGFYIYDQRLFSDIILPIYFEGMNSYKSFRRQLNLYGITKQFDQCKRKTGVPSKMIDLSFLPPNLPKKSYLFFGSFLLALRLTSVNRRDEIDPVLPPYVLTRQKGSSQYDDSQAEFSCEYFLSRKG